LAIQTRRPQIVGGVAGAVAQLAVQLVVQADQLAGQARELVTTTPNVFRIQNLINTLRAREYINSDHRYWFSPYTLAKVLSQAGYDDVEIDLVWDAPLRTGFSGMAKRLIGATWPATRDCLIARSHLN
jgi:hypothetical protein